MSLTDVIRWFRYRLTEHDPKAKKDLLCIDVFIEKNSKKKLKVGNVKGSFIGTHYDLQKRHIIKISHRKPRKKKIKFFKDNYLIVEHHPRSRYPLIFEPSTTTPMIIGYFNNLSQTYRICPVEYNRIFPDVEREDMVRQDIIERHPEPANPQYYTSKWKQKGFYQIEFPIKRKNKVYHLSIWIRPKITKKPSLYSIVNGTSRKIT